MLWQINSSNTYEWKKIEPISAPDIFQRTFYSALTFITLGAFLYFIRFYQALHFIIVEIIGSWSLYNGVKSLIWLLLMLTVYSFFPIIVDVINNIISFFYNIYSFIVFINHPLGITLCIATVYLLFQIYFEHKKSDEVIIINIEKNI